MPQDHPDPMRYIPTKEENEEAYDQAPACHHLTHRQAEREIEALERLLEE